RGGGPHLFPSLSLAVHRAVEIEWQAEITNVGVETVRHILAIFVAPQHGPARFAVPHEKTRSARSVCLRLLAPAQAEVFYAFDLFSPNHLDPVVEVVLFEEQVADVLPPVADFEREVPLPLRRIGARDTIGLRGIARGESGRADLLAADDGVDEPRRVLLEVVVERRRAEAGVELGLEARRSSDVLARVARDLVRRHLDGRAVGAPDHAEHEGLGARPGAHGLPVEVAVEAAGQLAPPRLRV